METGIELIAKERLEQIEKHERSLAYDGWENRHYQLSTAASILCLHDSEHGCLELEDFIEDHCPTGWNKDLWEKMLRSDYKKRLITAGALIAAEIDRLIDL